MGCAGQGCGCSEEGHDAYHYIRVAEAGPLPLGLALLHVKGEQAGASPQSHSWYWWHSLSWRPLGGYRNTQFPMRTLMFPEAPHTEASFFSKLVTLPPV